MVNPSRRIGSGAALGTQEGEIRKTVDIFEAAATDNVPEIDRALASGISVNSRDVDGLTPLHHAAAHLANHAVDRLLKELDSKDPIDPTIEDNYGRTASSVALEVLGEQGVNMARKLRPYCYPSNE